MWSCHSVWLALLGLFNMHVLLQALCNLLRSPLHTGSCLSPGAFIPAVPVQPVVIRYPNRMVSSRLCYHTQTWQTCFVFLLATHNQRHQGHNELSPFFLNTNHPPWDMSWQRRGAVINEVFYFGGLLSVPTCFQCCPNDYRYLQTALLPVHRIAINASKTKNMVGHDRGSVC